MVILLVEYLYELLDNQNIEVVYPVSEHVYALVLDDGIMGECLVNASMSWDQFRFKCAADELVRHLFAEYFLCGLYKLTEVLRSLGLALDPRELFISPFECVDDLSRGELYAIEDQRTLLDQSRQEHGLIYFAGIVLQLVNELPGQDSIRSKAVFKHALESMQGREHLLLLVVIGIVLSRRHIACLELSLTDELDILLHVLEVAVKVIQQNAEFMITGLFTSFTESLYILLTDLDESLIHLIVLLSNQFKYTHGPADLLADLMEVRALACCLDVSLFDILFIQLT